MSGVKRVHLFVYGTLMSGEPAHALLEGAPQVEADARTLPRYDLIDLGGYPGMVEPGSSQVLGEVYAVEQRIFAALDEYEDAHAEYERVEITLESGARTQAYLYRGGRAGTPVPSGDWRRREVNGPEHD